MNALLPLLVGLHLFQAAPQPPANPLPPFPSAVPLAQGGTDHSRETNPSVRHLLLPPWRRIDPATLPKQPGLKDLKMSALRENAEGRSFRSSDDLWALFSLKDSKIMVDDEEWDRAAEIPGELQVAKNLCEFRSGENNWIEAWLDGKLIGARREVVCFSGSDLAGAGHLVIRTSCARGSNQGLRFYRIFESDWLAAATQDAAQWLPLNSANVSRLNAGAAIFMKRDYDCPNAEACEDIALHAAAAVTAVWINGVAVDLSRQGLPAGLLKTGRNTILLQVPPPIATGPVELLSLEKRQLLRLPQNVEVAAGQALQVRIEDGAARVVIDGIRRGWAIADQEEILFATAPGKHEVVLEWWRSAEALPTPEVSAVSAQISTLRRLDFGLDERCSSVAQAESPWAQVALLRGHAACESKFSLSAEEAALVGISLRFALPGGPQVTSDYRVTINGKPAPGSGGVHLLAGLLQTGDNRIQIELLGGAPLPEPALDLLDRAPRLPAAPSAAAAALSRLLIPAGPFVLNLEDITLTSFGANGQGALAAAARGDGLLNARPEILAWEDHLPDGRAAIDFGLERLRTWLRLEAATLPLTLVLPPAGPEPKFAGIEMVLFLNWAKQQPEGKNAAAAELETEAFARSSGLWPKWLQQRRDGAVTKLRGVIAEECPLAKVE